MLSGTIVLASLVPGCFEANTVVGDEHLGDEVFVQPTFPGIGEACSATESCRTGLTCTDSACEPSAASTAGTTCVVSAECEDGLKCVGPTGIIGECTLSLNGAAGDSCSTEIDCSTGLRCGIQGFGLQCVPEGAVDWGGACVTPTDCLSGLTCMASIDPTNPGVMCSPAVGGIPSFGVPTFAGETCQGRANGVTRAFYEVPGATSPAGQDGDFFRLPYPNDVRLVNGRVDLSGFPTPGAGLLGFDPVQVYVDAIEANESGFGTYPTVTFRFSNSINMPSAESPGVVKWVDITEGAPEYGRQEGVTWNANTAQGKYLCADWLSVRRPLGRPLLPNHTYAVWLTTDLLGGDEAAIERSEHLQALLDSAAPGDGALATAHAKYAGFRAHLGTEGIATADILNATVFTVGPTLDIMAGLAAAAEGAPAAVSSDWIKCGGTAVSPCSQAEDTRACGEQAADYDEYHLLVATPIFQQGTAPYLMEGGGIDVSVAPGSESVCVAIAVPTGSVMPIDGWPLVVYGHGTGGSFRSGMRDEVAGALARDGVAVLGFDAPQHGPRRGDSTESPNNLFFNFVNPAAARGNPLQGAADIITMARFASSLNVTSAESGGSAIQVDGAKLAYFGHSQGSTHGSLALPYATQFRGAVLSGNGASLMDSLLSKTAPVNIAMAVPFALQDMKTDGSLFGGDKHPVLTLLQHWIDPADPLNFAKIASRTRDEFVAPLHLFATYGLGDTFSPNVTMKTYVSAAGMVEVTAHSSADGASNLFSSPNDPMPPPYSSTFAADGIPVTLAVRQYGPPEGRDGHFVVFDVAEANADVVRFLSMSVEGLVPEVGQ
ncbi:MAG: hypothetical protein HRU17_02685 [Polyangiaceae bacterium]|nr:hypothetical protein [Polyangiaceae bacterium]